MRILKFRFWLKGKQQGILELRENNILDMGWEWDKVDQFTGLLDRQGKEIYEGDIVSWLGDENEYLDEIIFKDGAFLCKSDNELLGWVKPNECKVIGNIYENKNLLVA